MKDKTYLAKLCTVLLVFKHITHAIMHLTSAYVMSVVW